MTDEPEPIGAEGDADSHAGGAPEEFVGGFPSRDDDAVDRELEELLRRVREDLRAGRLTGWERPSDSGSEGG